MAGHAGHVLQSAALLAGLFAASWALGRARPDAVTARTRRQWERSLFGVIDPPALDGPAAVVAPRSRVAWDLSGPAAALSFLAAAMHLAAFPSHVAESALFGAFFLGVGAFQVAGGFALHARGSRRALNAVVAVGNAAVVAVWAASRTVGVPAGPEPWSPERVGLLDGAATACEIGLVLLAAVAMRRAQASEGDGSAA